jgi:hypothetical protein
MTGVRKVADQMNFPIKRINANTLREKPDAPCNPEKHTAVREVNQRDIYQYSEKVVVMCSAFVNASSVWLTSLLIQKSACHAGADIGLTLRSAASSFELAVLPSLEAP